MATWIAHLRIAEELLKRIDGLDAAQFAIGNIAPDSGIPDEERKTFNPPVEVTHFQPSNVKPRDHHDLDFYRRYLLDPSTHLHLRQVQVSLKAGVQPDSDPLRFSFRLGYFFHLVTDNLWSQRVGRPTKVRFPEQFAADPDFIWTVKDNWYGLDFLYVRAHPECLYWRVFLDAQPLAADLDFLPPEVLAQQLAYIKEYYQRTDAEIQTMIDAPYIYFTKEEMDRFILETSVDLQRIHHMLWIDHRDVANLHSAVSLLTNSQ